MPRVASCLILGVTLSLTTVLPANAQGLDPHVNWNPALTLTYPAPLNSTDHLNATAAVPGTFQYYQSSDQVTLSPAPAGTVLDFGYHFLCLTFTPDDSQYTSYNQNNPYPYGPQCALVSVQFVTSSSTPTMGSLFPLFPSGSPGHSAAFDDSGRMYLQNGYDVSILDSTSLSLLGTLSGAASDSGVIDLAMDTGLHRLFVSDDSHVRVYDTTSLALLDTISLPVVPGISGNLITLDAAFQRLYVAGNNSSFLATLDLTKAPTDPTRLSIIPTDDSATAVTVDPSSHLVFVAGGDGSSVRVIDGDSGRPDTFLSTLLTVGIQPGRDPGIAIDRHSHKVYISALGGIAEIDGDRNSASFGSVIDTISHADMHLVPLYGVAANATVFHPFDIDPDRQRAYVWISSFWCGQTPWLAVIDLSNKQMLSMTVLPNDPFNCQGGANAVQVSPFSHQVFLFDPYAYGAGWVRDTSTTSVETMAGASQQPVTVLLPGVSLTFSGVVADGTTTATTMDPASLNLTMPGVFALQGTGFDLTTSATVTSPITLCFNESSVRDPITFAGLHVMHGEGGTWVDRTSSRDYASGQVCATVNSLSPFAIARQTLPAHSILPLFDQTKANKLGSTVPIKIRVNNPDGTNASSSTLAVRVLGLRRVSDQAPGVLLDAGNSSPDATFRFDASLAGYIYNLKTTPLASGTWELTLGVGLDSTTYGLRFQVR